MTSLKLYFSGETQDETGLRRAFFQAFFQNQYAAIIEVWQISYFILNQEIQVHRRVVSSSLGDLYRLNFPGESSLHARNVRLEQRDITLIFSEAEIFFDNLPEIDTAMIIVGKGRVNFHPSDEIERHQLVRRYGKPYFEGDLEYTYLRAGASFFGENLSYEPAERSSSFPPPEMLGNLVYSIFTRNYPRSFTVENSLTGELLSFLPQSGETVIEMNVAGKGEFVYVYSPFAEEEIFFFDRTRGKLINSYNPSDGVGGQRRLFVRFGEKFEIDSYQIEASYRPETHQLAASALIKMNSTAVSLDSLQLRLNPILQIVRILDEKGRELFYSQDKFRRLVYIYLAEKVNRGESFQIQVFYRGRITPPPPTSDVLAQRPEVNILSSYDQDTFLFSQAADWYPAPVREKYFTFRLRLVIPESYQCLASGQLIEKYSLKEAESISELESLGNSVFVYESQVPVKYISFFIGKLVRGKKIQDGITLEHYTTQNWRHIGEDLPFKARDIIRKYEEYFGAPPFKSLSIVQRYWTTSGGHSPPGFIVLDALPLIRGPDILAFNPQSPVDLSFWPEYYLAHEIAHQWWGHGLTWNSYRDNWLTEGLAQFSTLLFLKEKYGQKDYEKMLKKLSSWVRKKSNVGPIILGIRLSHIDFEGYQSIVYNKAALVLLMLKDLLGEEVFFKGLKEFYRANLFQVVRTADFRMAMEKVSGRDLKEFFQDWFYSERLPEVRVEKRISKISNRVNLKLTVKQLKRPMIFPLEIILETEAEKKPYVFLIKEGEQTFTLDFPGNLKKLIVNPGDKVPGKFG